MNRISGYGPSVIVLATTVLVLVAGPFAVRKISYTYTGAQVQQASHRLEQGTILEQLNQAYRDIATVVEPSVVHISTEHVVEDPWGKAVRKSSSGSGWVYDEQGHIVTNHHVVDQSYRIEVQFHDGEIRGAEVVGSDPSTDVAVLKVMPGRLHPASRRDPLAEPIQQGDMVFAFGSPFDFRFSMSSGVVSGKGRSVGVIRDSQNRRFGYENFIQVDAAINPGNSGGPLADYLGRVIGMNTAIATGRQGGNSFDDGQFAGIGLAIPIEMIVPVVGQIVESGGVTKGYLGVKVVDRDNVVADELEVLRYTSSALVVGHISPSNAAHEAGLRLGDVVETINGQRARAVAAFEAQIDAAMASGEATLRVHRWNDVGDGAQTLEIVLRGDALRMLRHVSMVQVDTSINAVLELVGFPGRGVRVAYVEADGPARAAGIRRGDVISHVDDQAVTSVDQLRSLVSSMLPGRKIELRLWRYDGGTDQGRWLTLPLQLQRLDSLTHLGTLPPDQSLDELVALGIDRMATSTRELAAQHSVEYIPGVMILAIVPGSSLESVLMPGAIIYEVAGSPVRDTKSLVEALRSRGNLNSARGGAPVTVRLPSGDVLTNLRLHVETR